MINKIISFIRRKIFRIGRYRWDFQYSHGRWDSLRTEEMNRIFVARDLLQKYTHNGNILEIGCGEGVFFHNIPAEEYSFYEGIDLSEVAIKKITNSAKAVFHRADMETYIPSNAPFTVIVLNEVLYCSKNPSGLLKRYSRYFEKNGVFLIGMYDMPKSNETWQSLGNDFTELESIKVLQDSKVWYYKVLRNTK